jgi:hypothetical protein
MSTTLALLTLLLAPDSAAAAQPACQTFTRGDTASPALVRAWFADSGDQRVVVCPQPGAPASETPPLYFGESGVSRDGTVCSYTSHGLAIAGSGAARRLRRFDRTQAVAMALAAQDCPRPHAAAASEGYVMTYDVGRRAFAAIMELWLQFTAAGSAANPQQQPHVCCRLSASAAAAPGAATTAAILKRLRAAAAAGRLQASGVMRIVRLPGSALRHRYALFVKDPDKAQGRLPGQPGMYVIYVQKRLRAPYEVSDVGESN